jgi:hypothetical protein
MSAKTAEFPVVPCLEVWVIIRQGINQSGIQGGKFYFDLKAATDALRHLHQYQKGQKHREVSTFKEVDYGSFYVVEGCYFYHFSIQRVDFAGRQKYDLQQEFIDGQKAKMGFL